MVLRIRSTPCSSLKGLVRLVPRMVPPVGRMPLTASRLSGIEVPVDHAAPAVVHADDRAPVFGDARAGHPSDDGVEPGAIATAGQDGYAHRVDLLD